jgi:hypothetical protein
MKGLTALAAAVAVVAVIAGCGGSGKHDVKLVLARLPFYSAFTRSVVALMGL